MWIKNQIEVIETEISDADLHPSINVSLWIRTEGDYIHNGLTVKAKVAI
jgi:hypothetical protein